MAKTKIKEILKALITKGATALVKLIRTKLLPKAEEKYCKALQDAADKITDKAVDRVEDLTEETDKKKRVRNLYLLKLILETLSAVSETLVETINYIRENVDFKELDESNEETLVALAEIPGALENDGECGPDGCEIV